MDRLRRRQVFDGGYPVAGARVTVTADVAVHTHDFLEVAVLLAGEATYVSPTGRRPLPTGAVMAVRPGEWHGYTDCHRAEIGNLYLGSELLHGELRWLLGVPGLGRFLLQGGLAPGALARTARSAVARELMGLTRLAAAPGTAGAVRAVGHLCAVLSEIALIELSADPKRPTLSPVVTQTVTALSRQPEYPWTMAELGQLAGVSVSHLHRAFKSQLGQPPITWLARTRAELAAALLMQTDDPVSVIGRRVGWADPNYFSRCFRRAYQMSPSAYRSRNATA